MNIYSYYCTEWEDKKIHVTIEQRQVSLSLSFAARRWLTTYTYIAVLWEHTLIIMDMIYISTTHGW